MAVRTTPFRFPRGDGRRRCYYDYAKNIRNLTEKDLAVAAKKFFRPDELFLDGHRRPQERRVRNS